mmetsp:Transcript_1981/g.4998  ORF Transcript_1981/g.4998 Transcript_1981/m.4998 type:complete len:88 (+) Transcript_1981:63-326(+)
MRSRQVYRRTPQRSRLVSETSVGVMSAGTMKPEGRELRSDSSVEPRSRATMVAASRRPEHSAHHEANEDVQRERQFTAHAVSGAGDG